MGGVSRITHDFLKENDIACTMSSVLRGEGFADEAAEPEPTEERSGTTSSGTFAGAVGCNDNISEMMLSDEQ